MTSSDESLVSLAVLWSYSKSGLEQEFGGLQAETPSGNKAFFLWKGSLCLCLVCNSQKMSHQDKPEFLDESSTQQHLEWEI